jgi:acetate kinase
MDTILVVNAGSSSVKFQVYAVGSAGSLKRQLKGQVDGIGSRPRLRATGADGVVLMDRVYQTDVISDVTTALAVGGAWLRDELQIQPVAIGHRVVHGGPEYDRPVLVDREVLTHLERYISLARLHQPHNLAPIRSTSARFPDLPQVACFDTAFHRSHSALADHFAIPQKFHAEGIRRYGFHGLSYEYIASALPSVAPDLAAKQIIVAHLGSGASMCALNNGRSVESTMGFTALDGLPMGTRCGQIDPGVVLYLISEKGMSTAEVQKLPLSRLRLEGVVRHQQCMRELETSSDPNAAFAIDYFVYRIGPYAGMLAAALQGLDAFVFTGGIGENSAGARARIAFVVPTDEEQMIAQHTLSVLAAGAITQPHVARVS